MVRSINAVGDHSTYEIMTVTRKLHIAGAGKSSKGMKRSHGNLALCRGNGFNSLRIELLTEGVEVEHESFLHIFSFTFEFRCDVPPPADSLVVWIDFSFYPVVLPVLLSQYSEA
jgi:hypothetical protein